MSFYFKLVNKTRLMIIFVLKMQQIKTTLPQRTTHVCFLMSVPIIRRLDRVLTNLDAPISTSKNNSQHCKYTLSTEHFVKMPWFWYIDCLDQSRNKKSYGILKMTKIAMTSYIRFLFITCLFLNRLLPNDPKKR